MSNRDMIQIPRDLLERLMQATAQAINLSDDHMRHSREKWSADYLAAKALISPSEPIKEDASAAVARPRMRA